MQNHWRWLVNSEKMFMGCGLQSDKNYDGAHHKIVADTLSVREFGSVRRLHIRKERSMHKWNIFQNSTVVRITASAGTLVAVAAIAGAGWKWA